MNEKPKKLNKAKRKTFLSFPEQIKAAGRVFFCCETFTPKNVFFSFSGFIRGKHEKLLKQAERIKKPIHQQIDFPPLGSTKLRNCLSINQSLRLASVKFIFINSPPILRWSRNHGTELIKRTFYRLYGLLLFPI